MGERLLAAVHHRWAVLLVATVVVVDQATKALAGHGYLGGDEFSGGYVINPAAGGMVLDPLSGLWARPVLGAALDLAALVVVTVLILFAFRLRGLTKAAVLIIAAGWGSNILDRLGLSYLTAPAPHVRGAVDLGVLNTYNVADYAINAGLYLLAVAVLTAAARPAFRALRRSVRRPSLRWKPALGVVGVVMVVLLGVWVGTVAQYGRLRVAREDIKLLERNAATPDPAPAKASSGWVIIPLRNATLAEVRKRCRRDPLSVAQVGRRLWVHCRQSYR